jgi:hypothetical protein
VSTRRPHPPADTLNTERVENWRVRLQTLIAGERRAWFFAQMKKKTKRDFLIISPTLFPIKKFAASSLRIILHLLFTGVLTFLWDEQDLKLFSLLIVAVF